MKHTPTPVPIAITAVTWLVACSSAPNVEVGREPAGERRGGEGGFGNAGTEPGGGGSPGVLGASLSVHVEDPQALTIEIVTLRCGEACADVVAVAHGGRPPYGFAWSDGATAAQRKVCADATGQLEVTARDTAFDAGEFSYPGSTASASLQVQTLDCPGQDAEPCTERAPEGAFDPVVEWTFEGGENLATPIVGNLTDDNGDGRVDLDDIPDVVIHGQDALGQTVTHVIDGRGGKPHFTVAGADRGGTAALGDVTGDGRPDLVVPLWNPLAGRQLVLVEGTGTERWRVALPPQERGQSTTVALADLDADGSVEIIAERHVLDAAGMLRWSAPFADVGPWVSAATVDLDGDGQLEVVCGGVAYRHDGSEYYRNEQTLLLDGEGNSRGQFVAVADLEADGVPEVVVSNGEVLFVLGPDGATLRSREIQGAFPMALHDLNGDGRLEVLCSDGATYHAYDADLRELWGAPIEDGSGYASGTAFDFLGDGAAEALYNDERMTWAFSGHDGQVLFSQPRSSVTLIEYPVVADVDNDGSAEVLIAGNRPSLTVLGDREGRWVAARRIFNQEAYQVTNIREDGTVPRHPTPHWMVHNGFRTQAQVNADGNVCVPTATVRPGGE